MTWVCWKGKRQPASTGEYVCVHMRMRRIRHQNLQCGPGGWRARKTRHRNPQCGPEGWGARTTRHGNLQCGPGGWRSRKSRHGNPQCGPGGWGVRKTRHGNPQCGPGGWRTRKKMDLNAFLHQNKFPFSGKLRINFHLVLRIEHQIYIPSVYLHIGPLICVLWSSQIQT